MSKKKNKEHQVDVRPNDWVLMRGDEVIASDPDPKNLMRQYHSLKDSNVYITKNITDTHLFF